MTALITGASSGIGRSLALLFAADGYDVVLVARREAALQELAAEIVRRGRSAHVIAADLSVEDGAERLHERLQRDRLSVDVLVNNAGFGLQGRFDQIPLERQLAMIRLNVTSLTALTRLLVPDMIARNRGGILNVGSTAGFQPGPLMAVYYATKAYVLSFTEALAEELAGTSLKISCLAPGPTATEFAAEAAMTKSRLFKTGAMTADEVARIGFDGWKAGKILVVAGMRNRIGAASVRFAPRSLVRRIARRLNSLD
jgi:hypothetical protein